MTFTTGISKKLDQLAPPDEIRGKFHEMVCLQGSFATRQGEPSDNEILLVKGRAVSLIGDAEGREVCVALYNAPCVITPHVARTNAGISLTSIQYSEDVTTLQIPAKVLETEMINSLQVRDWANSILRDALTEKVGREWCLAALNARARLNWFRENYAGYEDQFLHSHIASYLGMTPVTLSRLRKTQKSN